MAHWPLTVDKAALQLASLPPPVPKQDHVQGPEPLKPEKMPEEQYDGGGVDEYELPFGGEAHTPFTILLALHPTLVLPLVHVQLHGPDPLKDEAVPDVQYGPGGVDKYEPPLGGEAQAGAPAAPVLQFAFCPPVVLKHCHVQGPEPERAVGVPTSQCLAGIADTEE